MSEAMDDAFDASLRHDMAIILTSMQAVYEQRVSVVHATQRDVQKAGWWARLTGVLGSGSRAQTTPDSTPPVVVTPLQPHGACCKCNQGKQ